MPRGLVLFLIWALAFWPAVIATGFVVAFTSWMPVLVFFLTWIGWAAMIVFGIYFVHPWLRKKI